MAGDMAMVAVQNVIAEIERVRAVYQEQPILAALAFALIVVAFTVALGKGRRENVSDSASRVTDDVDDRPQAPTGEDSNGASTCIESNFGRPDKSRPQLEGSMNPPCGPVLSNSAEPVKFENDFCYGHFQELHAPTYDKALRESGEYFFGEYFKTKKRIWESRLQVRFKVAPRVQDLYFGVELENYVPLNMWTRTTQAGLVKMLQQVVGDQVYHSPGDDPKKVKGHVERPVFTMPLYAFDQFIVTPKDEEPPKLNDPSIERMGHKRYGQVSAYKKMLQELELEVGPTYTFCFWGISQFLDKLKWEVVGLPYPMDFNKFCGGPPVHVVLYTLQDHPDGSKKDKRHIQPRKRYYFDLAFWSSKARPPVSRIYELLGVSPGESNGAVRRSQKSKQTWWRLPLICCTTR